MASRPDKLFHDKLADYQRQAPPGAWQRIDKGLDKSNGFSIFFKVAAAVLVIAMAGYVVWSSPSHNGESSQVLTSNIPDQPSSKNNAATSVPPEVFEKPEAPDIVASPSVNNETVAASYSLVARNKNSKRALESEHPQLSFELPIEESQLQSVEEIKTIDITATERTETVNEISSRKIIYSVEHAQSRFLKKNTPSFKDDEIETVRKQKITEVAYGVARSLKNSEIGFGELRQLKDEFFALDFLAGNDKITKNKN